MPDRGPIPVACTLLAADAERRGQDWRGVAAVALRAKSAVPNGVRLEFRPDHATTHQLLDLVIAERDCCGWATWTLTSTADATVVEVTATQVPPGGGHRHAGRPRPGHPGDPAAVTIIRRLFEVPD